MYRTMLAALLLSLLAAPLIHTARADEAADKAAITARLNRWAEAFNARDAAGICGVFAPDLVYSVPGALEGDRASLCQRLTEFANRPDTRLHYAPDIREIIVSGNTAVVRVIWTLSMNEGTNASKRQESGLDIFRRQPDGSWAIARFAGFDAGPVK